MIRKIVGRVLVVIGVAFCYLGDRLCRGGAWLADIDWEEEDELRSG